MNDKTVKYMNMLAAAFGAVPSTPRPTSDPKNYPLYLKENSPSPKELDRQRSDKETGGVKFSIVIDATGSDKELTGCTLVSVCAQTYPFYEIVIVSDKSSYSDLLTDQTAFVEETSLFEADRAIEGDAVLLLLSGDVLSPDALYLIANKLNDDPLEQLVYADNDRINGAVRSRPCFKPAYSPVSEICFDYVQRPLCARKRLHELTGGFSGAADHHEYVMKCFEAAGGAAHIPKVLLSIRDDRRYNGTPKPPKGFELIPGSFEGSLRLIPKNPVKGRTTVIIPDAADAEELKTCLEWIDVLSVKRRHDIVIGLGKAPNDALKEYLDSLKKNKAAAVAELYQNGVRSIPSVLNECASRYPADHFVFLSAAARIVSCDFIDELLCPLMLEGAAISGGKLYDPDGLLYHSGYVIGLEGWAGSLYSGTIDDKRDEQKCFYTSVQRNVSAVSGAFMAVSSEDFLNVGMFDESFSEVGWDIEFCLRAARKGLTTVYTPFAEAKLIRRLKSFDEASKDDLTRCYDVMRGTLMTGDKYYSPNFDCRSRIPLTAIKPYRPIVLNPNF